MIEPMLRLVLAREIGPALAHRLLAWFGSADDIFSASRDDLMRVAGVGPDRAAALLDPALADAADAELKAAEAGNVTLIPFGSPRYPKNLATIPAPPLLLWVKGRLEPHDALALAVVGPRKPSDYARQMAQSLLPPLCARGLTIVSGLASGIDAEAHQAALGCGGRTVAVVGQGLGARLYPASNQRLALRMLEEELGALVSVFPMAVEPSPGLFPQRNAVIAALSLGVLVIEAGEKSGSLITAGHAGEFGRAVLACPGDATRPNARGSNRLIADGAALVQSSDDALGAMAGELLRARAGLGLADTDSNVDALAESGDTENPRRPAPVAAKVKPRPTAPSDPISARVLEMLAEEHRMIDYLLDNLMGEGFGQGEIVQQILMLELGGHIRQMPGRVYTLEL